MIVRLFFVVLAAFYVFVITAALSTPTITRPYWTCTVAQLADGKCPHTHVQLKHPCAVYVAKEADGDAHQRLRDPADTVASHFVVVEIIPALPLRVLKVGECPDSIGGITRYDPEHGHWAELHPEEWVSP